MFNLTPIQIVIVLVVGFLVFGAKRLPGAGKSLGQALRGFRASLDGRDDRQAREDASPVEPAARRVAPGSVESPIIHFEPRSID